MLLVIMFLCSPLARIRVNDPQRFRDRLSRLCYIVCFKRFPHHNPIARTDTQACLWRYTSGRAARNLPAEDLSSGPSLTHKHRHKHRVLFISDLWGCKTAERERDRMNGYYYYCLYLADVCPVFFFLYSHSS